MFDLETASRRLSAMSFWFGTLAASLLVLGAFLPWVEGQNRSVGFTRLSEIAQQVTTGGIPLLALQAGALIASIVLGSVMVRPEIPAITVLLMAGGALNNTTVLLDVAQAQSQRLSLDLAVAVDLFPVGIYAAIGTACLVAIQATVVRVALFKENRRIAATAVEATST